MSRNVGTRADSIPVRHPRRRPYCAKDNAQACRHRRDKAKLRRENAPPCHDRRRLHTPCCRSAPLHHCCGVMLPVAASTTIVPVICGCKEQKYLKAPGVVNVIENVPSESSTFDRKLFGDTTVCGMSSSFVHVTVVPALTLSSCGPKVKFPILTAVASAAQTGVAARRRKAATPATAMLMRDFVLDMF